MPNTTTTKTVDTLNYVSGVTGGNLPMIDGTASSFSTLTGVLFDKANFATLNAYIGNLLNKVAYTIITDSSWNNILAWAKKGGMPTGSLVEIIDTMPIGEAYGEDGTTSGIVRDGVPNGIPGIGSTEWGDQTKHNPWSLAMPISNTAYLTVNKSKTFKVTIPYDEVVAGFRDINTVETWVSSVLSRMRLAIEMYEYNNALALVNGAIEGKYMKSITVPALATATQENMTTIVKNIMINAQKMKFPNTIYPMYNTMKALGDTAPAGIDTKYTCTGVLSDGLYLLVAPEYSANLKTELRAWTYNREELDIPNLTTITVDSLPDKVEGVLVDSNFFQIRDQLNVSDSIWNPEDRYWNYIHNLNQSYQFSPYAQALALVSA